MREQKKSSYSNDDWVGSSEFLLEHIIEFRLTTLKSLERV